MKHLLHLLFAITIVPCFLMAQITVSNAGFPIAGDTLITAVDNLPTNIPITAEGGNQVWDFSSLQAPFSRRIVFGEAMDGSQGISFPNASLVANIAEGTEGYYAVSSSTLELIGLYGADPLDLGLELLTRFDPSVVERRAPMNFFDINQTEGALLLPFSTDDLPGGILDELPITPDSLRIRITTERLDVVDAWGTLTTPSGTYEVLREKRTEIRETRLDAKLGFLDWQDITELAIGSLPEEGAELLGMDTSITHNYFAEGIKEIIAVVSLNNSETEVLSVEFKSDDIATNVQNASTLQPGVYAFPNPATENVRFEFSNLEAGNYELKLFNIVGAEVWSDRLYINGSRAIKVDISRLKKGTYLYNLINDKNQTLTTRRLIVLRP